jgi:outer membrane receptor protein involved in Fe transport
MLSVKARRPLFIAVCSLPLYVASVGGALAQVLEEVIVTAQKRAESAQDVPISILAFSGEQLKLTGAGNLEGLSDSIPNVNIADSPGVTKVVVRGLGSGTGNAGFEQSVGMYVDGIYASRAALFQSPFLDLERIEVLKGPQGVLFGKNSIAGALSLVSNRPTDTFEAELTGLYDFEYHSKELSGFVSGPLTDGLSGRLAARASEDDSYMDNKFHGDGVPKSDTGVARGMLQWDAADSTQVLLKVETSSLDEDGSNWQTFADYSPGTFPYELQNNPAYVPPTQPLTLGANVYKLALAAGEDFKYDNDSYINDLEKLKQDANNITLQVSQSLGDYQLVYLFGYGGYTRDQFTDQDFTAPSVSSSDQKENFDQYSHELRILSPQGRTLDYIAGLYYLDRNFKQDLDQDGFGFSPVLAFSTTGKYHETDDSYAAFGQVTWNISDRWHASAGVRYSEESKDATSWKFNRVYQTQESLADANPTLYALLGTLINRRDFSYGDKINESNVDPAFNVQWDFRPDSMAYLSWVKASKAGGFNTNETAGDLNNFSFDPEKAVSTELGVKTSLLGGRARLNAAVFHTEFDDLQVGSFDPAIGFVVTNAAKAESQGVELEGLLAATQSITLGATAAYLQAEYREFTASCPNNQVQAAKLDCYPNPNGISNNTVQDLKGVQLENAPEITATMYIDYSVPIGAGLRFGSRLDASYKDKTSLDFSQDENLFANDYWRFNYRISLASMENTWTVALTAFNLTDEQPPTFGGQEFLLPGVYWESRSRGREIELSATYRFE